MLLSEKRDGSNTMRFTKMQGAGNDYVYVNCFDEPVPNDPAELARRVSDRHFGIGGDGLILICPSDVADARMRMFNADGSEAEMCGNGVRCVAKYVYDHGICRNKTLRIETGRGVLTLELEIADEKVRRVRVDMGEPILDPARIRRFPRPLPGNRRFSRRKSVRPTSAAGWKTARWDLRVTCVSMGNPHCVTVCRQAAATTGCFRSVRRSKPIVTFPIGSTPSSSQVLSPRRGAHARSGSAAAGETARLRHRRLRGVRRRRSDRTDRTQGVGPPPRRRFGTGVGRQQPRLPDRRGRGSVSGEWNED